MRPVQQTWRTRRVARAGDVPHLREDVVALLERESPDTDMWAARLIVTELAANVVRHAYVDGGPGLIEVDIDYAGPGEAAITVRDWGRGFGHARRGVGLGIVANLSGDLRIETPPGRTEVHASIPAADPAETEPEPDCLRGLVDRDLFKLTTAPPPT